MSTPAEAIGSKWPLETVSVEFDELLMEDGVVENHQVQTTIFEHGQILIDLKVE